MTKKKGFEDLSLKGTFYEKHVFSIDFIKNLQLSYSHSGIDELESMLNNAFLKFVTLNKQKTSSTIDQSQERLSIIAYDLSKVAEKIARLSPEESFTLIQTAKSLNYPTQPQNFIREQLNFSEICRQASYNLNHDSHKKTARGAPNKDGNKGLIYSLIDIFILNPNNLIKCYWSEIEDSYKGDVFNFCKSIIIELGLDIIDSNIADNIEKYKKDLIPPKREN